MSNNPPRIFLRVNHWSGHPPSGRHKCTDLRYQGESYDSLCLKSKPYVITSLRTGLTADEHVACLFSLNPHREMSRTYLIQNQLPIGSSNSRRYGTEYRTLSFSSNLFVKLHRRKI